MDPLAKKRTWVNPYNFVQNNPLIRIDPYGLTDYTLNRKSGEVAQVGEANDEPDRILKTNRRGEVKYKNNGEAKVAIDNIEQGILSDGINLKDDNQLIEVGGEDQASIEGVERFALQLSDYVGREIGGTYFSLDQAEGTTHIGIGGYELNTETNTRNFGNNLNGVIDNLRDIQRYEFRGFFHTHPELSRGHDERFIPSPADIRLRNAGLLNNPNLRYFILTHPARFGDDFPTIIEYTND